MDSSNKALPVESSDAVELLYNNSNSGLFVSALAGSALVFGFGSAELDNANFYWWIRFVIVLSIRFLGTLWHKFRRINTPYDVNQAITQYVGRVTITAIFCSFYVVNVVQHAELIELTSTLIVVLAMAGGSATTLAVSKIAAMSYSVILLVPSSIYLK